MCLALGLAAGAGLGTTRNVAEAPWTGTPARDVAAGPTLMTTVAP